MKRLIYIFLCLLFLVSACHDDFLDLAPLDQVSDASFWKTDNDLKLYSNQFYVLFRSFKGRGVGIFMEDITSDNMAFVTIDSRLNGLLTVPASAGGENYDNSWSRTFAVNYNWDYVRSVNIMLENFHKVESPWESARQYVGEAYFFRAFLYFDLLMSYGDLPWVNTSLTPEDDRLYSSRISRSIIADSIVADLDKATAYMKSKGEVSSYRLNSELALLFKSRVCLYEGTWEKYHAGTVFGVDGSDGRKFLSLAADAAKMLMDRGLYSINNTGNPTSDYEVCFNQKDFTGNPEIMLWKDYSIDLGMVNHSQRYLEALYGWPGHFGINNWLVESYLCTDGLPISESPLYAGDLTLDDVFKNRDPRLGQSLFMPGDPSVIDGTDTISIFIRPTFENANNSRTGYRLKKSLNPHSRNPNAGETGNMLFRYAEALLNYAEAKAELGSLTQSDVDISINILRKRVAMPDLDINNITSDPNWEFPALSPIINEVRRERESRTCFRRDEAR